MDPRNAVETLSGLEPACRGRGHKLEPRAAARQLGLNNLVRDCLRIRGGALK